ncbi:MAG: polysaccharide biosynthesis/export family protein [Hyphomicrobiaceae bacterium]|nr:polysaccharide biosynthesis/export family protein [Hyphomicrobiaceae bacterium]
MPVRSHLLIVVFALAISGCASRGPLMGPDGPLWSGVPSSGYIVEDGTGEPLPVTHVSTHSSWGEPVVIPAGLTGPKAVADTDGPYLLDTGDQLRIFVYGQPNLSRLYTVDHAGQISVPLIGNVAARGLTTNGLEGVIRSRLGAEFVRDPEVTVDVQQNRPFFILGEVRNAGQFPYVSGMTVETAIAIAGGYSERASTRRFRITRRIDGFVEQIEAPADYVIKPGDTVFVYERFF